MVQMATTARPLRAEDLPTIPVPDDVAGYELVAGELVPVMPAGLQHGRVSGMLWRRLQDYETASKLGMVFLDSWFKLGLARDPQQVRAPDIAFVRKEKLRNLGGKLPQIAPFPPDLAVEVFSTENERKAKEFDQRFRDYLDAGIALVWIIYPDTRSATAFHPNGTGRFLRDKESLDGEDVLPGFRISLEELFAVVDLPTEDDQSQ
jgi:Uma2 family endonuclease